MLSVIAGDPRRIGRRIRQLFVALAATAGLIALPFPANAGLIFTSVRFDGAVRNSGGDGPVAGVEQHFTNVAFPPPNTGKDLPATNPPLPPQLQPSNNLRISYDHANSAPLNGSLYPRDLLWITSPTTGEVFANDLDEFLSTPVEFETHVYLEGLAANEQLNFAGIRIESGHLPPFPPATMTEISNNRGSIDDPIRVLLRLSAGDVGFGFLKVHFYYGTEERLIPEPATAALVMCAVIDLAMIRRRSG